MKAENILERLFDNIIKKVGEKKLREIEVNLDDIPEVTYSKEHNEKMQELFMIARKLEYDEEMKKL